MREYFRSGGLCLNIGKSQKYVARVKAKNMETHPAWSPGLAALAILFLFPGGGGCCRCFSFNTM